MALIVLITLLLVFNHWLLEPTVHALTELLELKALPWLLLGIGAWLVAGRSRER